ncbi:MAG: diphosphomevalonate decarboxylase [Myxococcales bacterium]|jgi:diphosphomevalonate decarboxylase
MNATSDDGGPHPEERSDDPAGRGGPAGFDRRGEGSRDPSRQAIAKARANIALAKYWGKSDEQLNLPAVPSVSITLDPMVTRTQVRFDADLPGDTFELDGVPASDEETQRVRELLDRVRAESGVTQHAAVRSENDFPTAAGLASSASGFCALAAAARAAAGLDFDRPAISALARASSVSAARSAYGGYVELPLAQPGAADHAAQELAPADHWPLRIVVAVTAEGRKKVGSTRGMIHTAQTSPYYPAWVDVSPRLAQQVREGILERDLPKLGTAMEHSTLSMHACAMAADPAVIYFQPPTLAVLSRVRELREQGLGVWATADAGPHVKALCHVDQVQQVQRALGSTMGVLRTLVAEPGPGVELEEPS